MIRELERGPRAVIKEVSGSGGGGHGTHGLRVEGSPGGRKV